MRRQKIQIPIIGLALALTIGLTACGGVANTTEQSTATQPTTRQTTSATDESTDVTYPQTADPAAVQDLLDSLDNLGELTDGLDDINMTDLVIPEA